jgi:hypothetical protein
MKISCDIWRRFDDDERSLWLDFPICCKFRLEEPLFLPPCIPSGFNGRRVISFVLRVIEGFYDCRASQRLCRVYLVLLARLTFLFSCWCIFNISGQNIFLGFLLSLCLLLLALAGEGYSSFGRGLSFLLVKLGLLLCLLPLSFYYWSNESEV